MFLNQKSASAAFEIFLQKAQHLDLSSIAYLLMQSKVGPGWTKAQTVKAITQYLAFLYLADYYPHLQLVPSSEVDQVWHYHILDTQKYAEDCQMLFGYMIHHLPYLGLRVKQDEYNQCKAYALTQVLLSKHFNENFTEDSSPGDCEPIRSKVVSGTNYNSVEQFRPRASVAMDEVLRTLSN